MADWHYAVGGQRQGPVAEHDLRNLIASGQIPATTLVWSEGMPDWVAAGTLPQFSGGSIPPLPPQTTPLLPSLPLSDVTLKKGLAAVCGILAGQFGLHKFILGLNTPGAIMLVITLGGYLLTPFTLGASLICPAIMHGVGVIEGILYLVRSDAEFQQRYVVEKQAWF